jgi:hypothetical protein
MRKLILVGLVVVVALFVFRKTELGSLLRVWWHGGKAHLEASVPLETRIEQLKLTIADVEKRGEALRVRQSKLEVAAEDVKKEVDRLKGTAETREAEVKELISTVEKESAQVGKLATASDAQKRLDRATRDLNSTRSLLRAKKDLLDAKKQIVEASEDQRQKVRQKVTELNTEVARLEVRLVQLRNQQAESAPVDDRETAEAQRLVGLIEKALRESEKLEEIKIRDGQVSTRTDAAAQSREESLKAARKALVGDE